MYAQFQIDYIQKYNYYVLRFIILVKKENKLNYVYCYIYNIYFVVSRIIDMNVLFI